MPIAIAGHDFPGVPSGFLSMRPILLELLGEQEGADVICMRSWVRDYNNEERLLSVD